MDRGNQLGFVFTFMLATFVAWFNYPYGIYMYFYPALIMLIGMGKAEEKRDVKLAG